jgi:hypothetical protein
MAAKKKTEKTEKKTAAPKKTGVVAKKAVRDVTGGIRVKRTTKGKVRVVGGKVTRKRIKAPPSQEAKRLVKRAEWSEKRAVRFAKNAEKLREKAAKLAAKALAKPQCRYSPKMQAALAEIAKLGQEFEVPQDEALQVVADVLKGEFK